MSRINTVKVATSLRLSSVQRLITTTSPTRLPTLNLLPRRTLPAARSFTTTKPTHFINTTSKMGVHNLSDKASFDTAVKDAKDKIVVVDFFATWCGPCKMIAPAIVKMSNEDAYTGVEFVKIDVDEVPDVAQELGIRAMPTFAIFKNGEKVDEVVGANERALRSKIDAVLKSEAEGTKYEAPPATVTTNWLSYLPILILAVLAYRWFMGT